MVLRSLIALVLIAAPVMVAAQDQAGGKPPQRIRNILLQPGEKCPTASSADEIVVCGQADAEQYRVPKALRDEPKTTVTNTAWATRVDRVMEDNRRVLPGSCSPVGMQGQSGCSMKAAEAWAAERRAVANGQTVQPQ